VYEEHGAVYRSCQLCAARVQTDRTPRRLVDSVPQLLPVERDWLRYLADLGTVAGLARSLGCSEREMYRKLGGVYARLGASNRSEALELARRRGLLGD
jgi:DNA-binding CsgD family transcriptional regulator